MKSPLTVHKTAPFALSQKLGVKYQVSVLNADGTVALALPAKSNLIMDAGLDAYAGNDFVDLFQYAIAGTGTNPVSRTSSPITFTQAASIVTASAPFFANTDVGYILKYGTGSGGAEQYITGFIDSTHVTVGSSATVGSIIATVWYVTQTTLQTAVKNTNSYAGSGQGTATAISGANCTFTHTRIFIFSAESGSITYNEIGWSWNGTNVFGRDLILPSGVALIAGQQLQVTLIVSNQVSPAATVAVGDVSGGTWNTAGNAILEFLFGTSSGQNAFYSLSASGTKVGARGILEPASVSNLTLIEATWSQATATQNTTNTAGIGATDQVGFSGNTYVPGSFQRIYTAAIGTGSLNGITWYGLGISGLSDVGSCWTWSLQLTTPNSKDSSHTLTFVFTTSWSRILVN